MGKISFRMGRTILRLTPSIPTALEVIDTMLCLTSHAVN